MAISSADFPSVTTIEVMIMMAPGDSLLSSLPPEMFRQSLSWLFSVVLLISVGSAQYHTLQNNRCKRLIEAQKSPQQKRLDYFQWIHFPKVSLTSPLSLPLSFRCSLPLSIQSEHG
jgi:hypothetical protein